MKDQDQKLRWTPVSTESLADDEWMNFRKIQYQFPDGSEFGPYYQYSGRSYVVIVAEDSEGRLLCVRQYRHGIDEVTVEFTAGGIESGVPFTARGQQRVSEETALAAAKRELLEETGCTSEEWTHLLTVPSHATIADNYAHVYCARNCRRSAELHLDDTEFLEPERHTPEEIEALIADGTFAQAIHVMAWLLYRRMH